MQRDADWTTAVREAGGTRIVRFLDQVSNVQVVLRWIVAKRFHESFMAAHFGADQVLTAPIAAFVVVAVRLFAFAISNFADEARRYSAQLLDRPSRAKGSMHLQRKLPFVLFAVCS